MPIINVNMFQDGINKKDYLTTYTDQYVKQSLANLGQRLGVKGDSIGSTSIKVSSLFPDYLGNLDEKGLLAYFRHDPTNQVIVGTIANYEDGKITPKASTDSGSTFTVSDIDYPLYDITTDQYNSEFELDNGNKINDTEYWHRSGAILYKGTDNYIYKLTAHKDGARSDLEEYDKEYICEEVSSGTNTLKSGFRIVIANEDEILSEYGDDIHEKLYILYLYENEDKETKTKYEYLLNVYKIADSAYYEIGDFTSEVMFDVDSNIGKNTANTSTPSEIISELTNDSSLWTSTSVEGKPIVSLVYNEIPVYYDSSKNVYFSIKDKIANFKSDKFEGTVDVDQDFIESKLEYFTNDLTMLYPKVKSIYNEIVYESDDNINIKRQIVAELVKKLHEDSQFDEEDRKTNPFDVVFPINYEFVCNSNSNDESIIYNSIRNVSVYFKEFETIDDTETNLSGITEFEKISNQSDKNSEIVISGSDVSRVALYDFSITYDENNIVDSIKWNVTINMPYIKGDNWYINNEDSEVSAKGIADSITNFMIVTSAPSGYKIIHSSDQELMETMQWKTEQVPVDYADTTDSFGNPIIMSAWVPNVEVTYASDPEYAAAIKNSLMLNIVSTSYQVSPELYIMTDQTKVTGPYETIQSYITNNYWKDCPSSAKGWGAYLDPNGDVNGYTSYVYWLVTNPTSIVSKLGEGSVMTTLWHAIYNEDESTYKFAYIARPNNGKIALDLTYLSNVNSIISYSMNTNFQPDNYEHSWLVFDMIDGALKNSNSSLQNAWPVMRNYDSTYFSKSIGQDPSMSIGSANEDLINDPSKTLYGNNLNFSVGFFDSVSKGANNEIDSVDNSSNRLFHIKETIVPTTYTYIDYSDQKNKEGEFKLIYTYEKYGTIPLLIPYNHKDDKEVYEYTPNSKYDATKDSDASYQYPIMDFKEMLLRNSNTLNRLNILGLENRKIDETTTLGVIYNAYIGVPYDIEDKSMLHIGTSSTNINLGTTTMVDDEDRENLTPMKGLSIDFDNTHISGDVDIQGNLNTQSQTWTKNVLSDGVILYSTIVTPSSIYNYTDANDDNTVSYSPEVLQTVRFNVDKETKYFTPTEDDKKMYVSYLNVSRLLQDNNIAVDDFSYIYGDKQFISWRTCHEGGEKTHRTYVAYYLELSTDLSDDENLTYALKDKTINMKTRYVVSNPIQISYCDIVSYTKTITLSDVKTYIYAYLYCDSYSEVWSCTGCDLCTGADCKMIKFCKHSYVVGAPHYAYGFTTKEEDYNENVLTCYHPRQYKDENNKVVDYKVKAYYPVSKLVPVSSYTYQDNDGNDIYMQYDLDTDSWTVNIEEKKRVDITYTYGGFNIMCPNLDDYNTIYKTSYEYIQDYNSSTPLETYGQIGQEEVDKNGSKKFVTVTADNVTYKYVDNTSHKDLKEEYNINHEIKREVDPYNVCTSYVTLHDGDPQTYWLTQRYVNVREIMTTNSRPYYYNSNIK